MKKWYLLSVIVAFLIVVQITNVSADSTEVDQVNIEKDSVQSGNFTTKEFIEDGKSISFLLNSAEKDWVRPTYSKEWDDPSIVERLPNIKKYIAEMSMHRLFTVPTSASESFPFYTIIGIDPSIGKYEKLELAVDNKIGFYIINGVVKDVKNLNNHIGIVIEPTREGYQEVWIDKNDVQKHGEMITHLITPDGYEIDFLPIKIN